jgi:hypothetical protein
VSVINLNEQDFSLCVDYDLPQQDLPTIRKLNKLLVSALLISLLFHLLLFLLKPFWYSPEVQTSQSVVITLQKLKEPEALIPDVIKAESIQLDSTNEFSAQAEEWVEIKPQKNSEVNIIASQSFSNQSIPDSTVIKPLELLSAEDYADLAQNNSEINNTDSLAFNPHLKQQLQKTRQVTNERGKKSISWQDTGGNLYYKVGGQCFMSPPQNAKSSVREGKNWYMVSCPGKSESEKMMDNVNQEMKERFKQ